MTDRRVRDYLQAIEARLGDLPADERDDLLSELEANLADVAAEGPDPLNARLGPPDRYVAELRESAGLPPMVAPAEPASASTRFARIWRSGPVRTFTRSRVAAVLLVVVGTVFILDGVGAFDGDGGPDPDAFLIDPVDGVLPLHVCGSDEAFDEDGRPMPPVRPLPRVRSFSYSDDAELPPRLKEKLRLLEEREDNASVECLDLR